MDKNGYFGSFSCSERLNRPHIALCSLAFLGSPGIFGLFSYWPRFIFILMLDSRFLVNFTIVQDIYPGILYFRLANWPICLFSTRNFLNKRSY